jgi:hypothetical protein
MPYLGVFNFNRVLARLAFFRHAAAGATTTVTDLTDRKWVPRHHGDHYDGHWSDREVVVNAENADVGNLCGVRSPALYPSPEAPYLYGWVAAGMECFPESVCVEEGIRGAVCAVYGRSVACTKGCHSRTLLHSAALRLY